MVTMLRNGARRLAPLLALALLAVGGHLLSAQAPAARRAAGPPDLNGLWQAIGTANDDLQDHMAIPGPSQFGAMFGRPPGQGVVDGNEIPYQPWALAKKKENFANRLTQDPEAKCFLPGVPRATYMPEPFQIVQTPRYVLIAYQYAGAMRTIHVNQAKPNPVDNAVETWMGYSTGRWDGQTLVVEATGFNGQAWFDRAGNFASETLKVTERYTPAGADHMSYEATIEDPKVFTRPWKISLPLYRIKARNAQLLEHKCIDFAEDMLYGHLYKKGTE